MINVPRVIFVASLLLLVSGCSRSPAPMPATPGGSAGEGEWPTFHGSQRDNISHETGLLTQWPADGPAMIWAAQGIGEGYATVSIADGAVYTSGNLDDQTVVTALALDGSIRWQAPIGRAWTDSHEGSRATPTIDGDRLYCSSPHGELVCLRTEDGQPVWQVDILQRFGGRNIQWGLAESPLIDGDLVICTPGGSKGRVAALDKTSGDTIWATGSGTGSAGYASAMVTEIHGKRTILTMSGKALLAVDAQDGRLLFEFPLETDYDVHATTPICVGNRVFISAGYGSGSVMLQIQQDGDAFRADEEWRSTELDNHHGGVVLWEGHLYGAAHKANRGQWICLEWETGKLCYAEKGVGKGSVLCVGGMLYTLSEKSRMGLVQATPESHTLISQFDVPKGGDGPTWAHPVVCGGFLYLRHGDRLYCYDVREPATAAPQSMPAES